MASTVDGALRSGAVLPRAGEVRAYGEQGATVRAVDVGVEDDGGGEGGTSMSVYAVRSIAQG